LTLLMIKLSLPVEAFRPLHSVWPGGAGGYEKKANQKQYG
jgi:hypothetical protein